MDGHICTWYWNTLESVDIDENDPFEEINPVSEIILPNSQLISINHRRNNEWFTQVYDKIIVFIFSIFINKILMTFKIGCSWCYLGNKFEI